MPLEKPDSHQTPQICTKSHFTAYTPAKQAKSKKKFNEIKDLDAIRVQKRREKVLINQGPANGCGSGR
jgi:hypothetical protein